ncbi:hypothetical protein MHYP_G00170840 [Metynnis hypsauchen]
MNKTLSEYKAGIQINMSSNLIQDHLVSSIGDEAEAIRELLEVQLEEEFLESVQPLENETVMMKVAEEAEAEATTEHMDINLDDTQKEPLEKRLDHLVSSNDDEAESISELLEVQLEEEVSASVQPPENETTMMVADEAEAEATTEHVSTHLEETEEEPLEKRLRKSSSELQR